MKALAIAIFLAALIACFYAVYEARGAEPMWPMGVKMHYIARCKAEMKDPRTCETREGRQISFTLVQHVSCPSRANYWGMRSGDVITAVNDIPVRGLQPEHVDALWYPRQGELKIQIERLFDDEYNGTLTLTIRKYPYPELRKIPTCQLSLADV